MSARPNHLEDHARELLKMPPEWRWFRWERLPVDAKTTTHTMVTGAVCTATFASGKRKGRTNWSKRDPNTERSVVISDSEHDAYLIQWEERTGHCHECGGTSQRWCGWSVTEGDRYRDCPRCNATGKRPVAEVPSP